MPECSACGYQLGDPETELADPNGLEGDPTNRPDAHFELVEGPNNSVRHKCRKTGQLASVAFPGEEGDGSGTGEPQQNQQPPQGQGGGDVYDIDEEVSAEDILRDVVTNPSYELNESQIREIQDWAEIYDGQIPPDTLEDVLKSLQGVAKQKATLMRQKYEAKLNKWVQEQSNSERGPPIGVTAPPPNPNQNGRGRSPRPSPQPTPNEGGGGGKSKEELISERPRPSPGDNKSLREKRRERRIERRNDAADIAAEEMAKAAAPEIARELTQNFGTYFSLPAKILEAKIEKDPDWVFEKMEEWDIDLDALLEPSETRKEELEQQRGPPKPDAEVNDALSNLTGSEEPKPSPEPEPTSEPRREPEPEPDPEPEPQGEKVNSTGDEGGEEGEMEGPDWVDDLASEEEEFPLDGEAVDPEEEEQDEAFEEQFGEI